MGTMAAVPLRVGAATYRDAGVTALRVSTLLYAMAAEIAVSTTPPPTTDQTIGAS